MSRYSTRDTLIYTIAGEAGRESTAGQSAVAHNILNRYYSGRYGSSIEGVVMAPGQYSMWNDVTGYAGGKGGNSQQVISRLSESEYNRYGSVVDAAMTGQSSDPTGGSLNYYNPSIASPSWGRGSERWSETGEIGGHVFGTAGGSHYDGTNADDPRYNIGSKIGYDQFSNANVSEDVAPGSFSDKFGYNPDYSDFSGRNVSEDVKDGSFADFGGSGTGSDLNKDGTETSKSFSTDPEPTQETYLEGDRVSAPSAGTQGMGGSVPQAIVSAANQEAKATASSAKATAEATLKAAQTTAASDAKLQGSQQSWASNWAVRIFLFIVGAIFLAGALFLFGGQTIFQAKQA